jgi:hypothetical protein
VGNPDSIECTQLADARSLRPYADSEVPAAMARVLQGPLFDQVRRGYFPQATTAQLAALGARVQGWRDFQKLFIKPAIDQLIARSSDGFSISGLARLDRARRYVFVSNHRDIVCDPALFTYGLHVEGWDSPFVCLGDNLLVNSWIVDLVKMNRGVTVKRGLTARELLRWSKALSRVVQDAVGAGEASVWIAQREGRAKDGVDETHPGVIKMLALASEAELLDSLEALHLVPVAISYEYDPCDVLKARELAIIEREGAYRKAPGEDVRSMAKGIGEAKGRIHVEVGAELADDVRAARGRPSRKEQLQAVASAMDREIRALYRLWPTAYIARDWLRGGVPPQGAGDGYVEPEARRFRERLASSLASSLAGSGGEPAVEPELRAAVERKVLEMYARPLIS